jgi:hypothetical protein
MAITPRDFVSLHATVPGWRPDQAAVDAFDAINAGQLPLADYQQRVADMGGGAAVFGSLAPAMARGDVKGAMPAMPAGSAAVAAPASGVGPGGQSVSDIAQNYINSYKNWLATGRWG